MILLPCGYILLFSEETVGGTNRSSTVTLTEKEAIVRKVKLIVRKTYQGKQKNKDGKRVRSFLVSDADDGFIWTGAVGGGIVR